MFMFSKCPQVVPKFFQRYLQMPQRCLSDVPTCPKNVNKISSRLPQDLPQIRPNKKSINPLACKAKKNSIDQSMNYGIFKIFKV